jgi:hypothetical protein
MQAYAAILEARRFPDTGLTDQCHNLPGSCCRTFQGVIQRANSIMCPPQYLQVGR